MDMNSTFIITEIYNTHITKIQTATSYYLRSCLTNSTNCYIIYIGINPLVVTFLFGSGLLTSLTPCTLSVLPLTIGYVSGYADKDDSKYT